MPNTNDGLKNTQRQQNPTLKVFKKRLKKVFTLSEDMLDCYQVRGNNKTKQKEKQYDKKRN